MIRSGLILMIKDLAGKGKSAYAIGQEIGISKNTARKYMEQADAKIATPAPSARDLSTTLPEF